MLLSNKIQFDFYECDLTLCGLYVNMCSESVMWNCDTAGFWLTGGFSCLHDNKGW